MSIELEKRIDEHKEVVSFNKELENIFKKRKRKLKNMISEVKINLGGTNNRLGDAEEYISDLEDRIMGIIHRRVKRKTPEKTTNKTGIIYQAMSLLCPRYWLLTPGGKMLAKL